MHDQDLPTFHDAILDAAVAIMRSDFASLHRLDTSRDARGELELLCVIGFTPETSADWGRVTVASDSACGKALQSGTRLVVADLEDGTIGREAPEHAIFRHAGVRALQATPLVTRGGTTVGMLSTHWRQPRAPTERECRLFDILARQVADLLERTEAVTALRRSERELKEADRRKNEFLAVLAHELRNPLAPVRTGLELMRLAGDNRFSVERVRDMMERQVGHMVRLIDDLLDVSRITSGKIRLQREISLLPELVQGAIEASRAGLTAGRFELAVELPSDPVWLDVDPTRFVQVVSNLLHNALKFSEDGGRIAIAGRVVELEPGAGKELMLTVTDSGIGIRARCCRGCSTCSPRTSPPSTARTRASASVWRWRAASWRCTAAASRPRATAPGWAAPSSSGCQSCRTAPRSLRLCPDKGRARRRAPCW